MATVLEPGVLEPGIVRAPAAASSDRSFGMVGAAAFTVIGAWPLVRLETPRWWALALAFTFSATALIRPQLLSTLNRAWLSLGRLLHKVMSPMVMGVIFFVAVVPTALIMRRLGKDVLSLERRGDLESYWITRSSATGAQSMKQQF